MGIPAKPLDPKLDIRVAGNDIKITLLGDNVTCFVMSDRGHPLCGLLFLRFEV